MKQRVRQWKIVFCFAVVHLVGGTLGFLNQIASTLFSTAKNSIPGLQGVMEQPTADVILTLDTPMSPIIEQFSQMTFSNREDQASNMVSALQAATIASQAPILAALSALNFHAEPYWITNQIYVRGATPPLIQTLAEFAQIKNILEDRKFPLIPIFNATTGTPPNGTLWNVQKIKAPRLWKEGIKGKGIVVASIDTGVRGTHNAIKQNYVGNENYGWHDPIWFTSEPNDMQGHGTHTVGTMVGRNGIGAAPRAKWMACRGCSMQSCLQHALLACGQFVLCPSDPKSKRLNCTHVPHIVNNSWGGPGGQTWYDDVINAWKAVGIIPFFANGNSGPNCETAGSPGDNENVIAVGSTDSHDKLSKFSSRGPKVTLQENQGNGIFGQINNAIPKKKQVTDGIKPDVCAPGHQINSAGILTDNSYKVLSGTSMATPLTAGATALLMSKNPNLTTDEIKYLLYSTAEQKLPPSGTQQCGTIVETEFPNNMYGHGRLNIYKAYKKMLHMMKKKEKEEEDRKKDEEEQEEDDPTDGLDDEAVTPDEDDVEDITLPPNDERESR